MGVRDDNQWAFEQDALLQWARQAPEAPGSYDTPASEEAKAAHEYERRKWMERKPRVKSYPDEEF